MKKLTLLLLNVFLMLSFVSAEIFDNLYLVGNACDAGWSFEKSLPMTKESEGIFTWTGILQDNTGDNGLRRFKFLTTNTDWHPSVTCQIAEEGHTMATPGQEHELYVKEGEAGNDNAFQVAETAEYTVNINLNTMKMVITKTGDIEEPTPDLTQLYLTGSAISEDGTWDFDNPVEMTMQADGIFTWTGNLYNVETKNEFKFKNISNSWDKTFCAIDDQDENRNIAIGEFQIKFRPYEASAGDNNFKVPTPGRYTITVDLNQLKMTVADGGSGIKNAFSNEAPFNISALNGKINIAFNENVKADIVEVFDITGKTITKVKDISGSTAVAENLHNNIYLVKINCDGSTYATKICIK